MRTPTAIFSTALAACAGLALGPAASAQIGNVDQHSLRGLQGAVLHTGQGTLAQQQVSAGRTGQLTGVEFYLTGNPGEAVTVRVRPGGVPNAQPALWESAAVKATNSGWELPLLDVSGAGIQLVQGQLFTLELEILTPGGGFASVDETPPCYPDPMSPVLPIWPDLRLCFRTWMSDPAPGTSYCPPSPSTVGLPVRMWAQGTTSIASDDLVLLAGPMPDSPALFYFGTQTMQLPFGNGFACVSGILGRLPGAVPHCGTMITPFELVQLPPQVVTPGQTLYAQCWFRDPFGGGGPFNFGFSEAYAFTLTP